MMPTDTGKRPQGRANPWKERERVVVVGGAKARHRQDYQVDLRRKKENDCKRGGKSFAGWSRREAWEVCDRKKKGAIH